MKKKVVSVILTAAMAASMLAGCGSTGTTDTAAVDNAAEDEQDTGVTEKEKDATAQPLDTSNLDGTTITFWHSMGGVNGEALQTLVDKFNAENEYGITVDAQYQGEYDDTINKLKSAQIGNMGADLVQIYDIGTRFMIDSGWIVPMQELMDQAGFDSSVIEPNIAAYYTVDDELYSMPFNSSTPIMYYNKDMFDAAGITEIPTSLEQIAKISDKLTTDGGAEETISLGIYGWFFEQFVCKQGAA